REYPDLGSGDCVLELTHPCVIGPDDEEADRNRRAGDMSVGGQGRGEGGQEVVPVRDEHHCCLPPCVSGWCLWLRSAAGVHVFVLQPCPCPPRAEPAAGASPSVLIIAPFPLRAQALLRWSGMAGWRPLSHSPAGRTPRRGDSAVRRRCGKAATLSSSGVCSVR